MKKLLLILLLLLLTTSCSANQQADTTSTNSSTVAASTGTFQPLSEIKLMLGTQCTISLYDKQEQSIIDKCFDRISQLELMLSANESGTEIDLINSMSGQSPTKVSKETYDLVKTGLEYSKLSSGLFDITIGMLVNLWHIGFDDARVPLQTEIDNILGKWNYEDVALNDQDKSVFLKKEGMMLDLGAVAKGYIADEVKKVLVENGVESAIINLGGNILLVGNRIANEKVSNFTIGIRNPYDDDSKSRLGDLKISDKSIVTSGIYERYLISDGISYHHLLNPFDGYPYDNELVSLSIISDLSVDGDGLSTSVFAKGLNGGFEFLEEIKKDDRYSSVEAIFVTKDNKVYITDGLKDMFSLVNKEFTIMK